MVAVGSTWEAGTGGLSDGRLDVGTHLPLLGKRYRFVSLLGEGTSAQVRQQREVRESRHLVRARIVRRALWLPQLLISGAVRVCLLQVILAQDVLHPAHELVAVKVMKRQFSYAGQKVPPVESCSTAMLS